jgi:hypothetical protein
MVKLNLKSQVALQFVIIIGILLFVFIAFFAILSEKNQEDNEEKLMIQAQDIIYSVQREIVIATTVLDGYLRQFRIPSTIGLNDYSIYIQGPSNTTLVLNFLNNDFTKRIPPANGQPKPGLNNITKSGGEVYLN